MKKEINKANSIDPLDLSRVKELVAKVNKNEQIDVIKRLGGLTNRTYYVHTNKKHEYAVRIPGAGTEKMINRQDEKNSTKLAYELGIDAECLYFTDDGAKVSVYIDSAETMTKATLHAESHIAEAADLLRTLHNSGVSTGINFDVFDLADLYREIIQEHQVAMFPDYPEVEEVVGAIKAEMEAQEDIALVPCHNDPLCANWVYGKDQNAKPRMYLLDWEYAGMNDPMWDLADLAIEAEFDFSYEKILLADYFGEKLDLSTWKHFYASKIYVDYLWMLWAKARVPFMGQFMEDWADERYSRLKDSITIFDLLSKRV